MQGFGNVGGVAAQELADRGATVLAVSDISGGVYASAGSTSRRRARWVRDHGSLADYPDCERVTNAELLELPCDILVLAALEDQLTAENAPRVATKLIAEGANGPTDNEADAILADRGIPVLPDILTNAGGVTVSYFEWVQDLGRLFWTRDEIRARLADKLGDAFDRVWNLADSSEMTLRSAALVAGIQEARRRSTRAGSTHDRVRDAMIPDPHALESSASAQEAGELFARPEVRAVLVCDGGRLMGVVTRKTLVREVVARGRHPARRRSARSPRSRSSPSTPRWSSSRRSACSRSTTSSACRSSRTGGSSACSRARSSSGGSPRTRRPAGRRSAPIGCPLRPGEGRRGSARPGSPDSTSGSGLPLAAGVGAGRRVALDRLGQLGRGERCAVEDVALADGHRESRP